MSKQYFEATVSFLKQNENGLIKAVKELYLVDALSFTEVEARLTQEVSANNREITVNAIRRSDVKELVIVGDTDLWFKVKVAYSVEEEDSEKAKKITLMLLVNANDIDEATDRTRDHLKDMLVPYEIPKVEKSKICEVYEYVKPTPFTVHFHKADGTVTPIMEDGKIFDNGGHNEEE